MIWKYLYFFNIFLLCSSDVCFHLLKYKTPTDVIVHCNDQSFTVDPARHKVEWGSFNHLFPHQHPYFYLKNGSLLVKGVSEDSSHYLCEVKDIHTNASLHKCGTSVVIIKPLVMKYTPVNETVEKGFKYKINCHGGGGDYVNWKLTYYVNDTEVSSVSTIIINEDTKIECRLVSGDDTLSVVAFIKVKKEGGLTDEEKLLQTKCAPLNDGICAKKFPDKLFRIHSSYESSRTIIEQILKESFQALDNNIIAEYNEDSCVDRFQRLLCSTLYSPCTSSADNQFTRKDVCRESCDVTIETVCRNTIQRIKKVFDHYIKQFSTLNERADDYEVPPYRRKFIARTLELAQSVFNCTRLQYYRNRTKSELCSLLNLDVISAPTFKQELTSSQCYNGVGRNFTGEVSQTVSNTKCIEWRRVPHLYIAFYQQNLQNQSSYCRNPGSILKSPMCLGTTMKSEGELSLRDVNMIPCTQIYTCEYYLILKKSRIEKGSVPIFIISGVSVLAIIIIVVIISFKFMGKKVYRKRKKKLIHADEMSLNDTHIQLFDNKTYMYKNVQNGHYSCPIYNSACLERVFKISDGAYGEILLVQAVFEDSTQLVVDENAYSTAEKNNFSTKDNYESDDNSMDDFILSKDKTFNGKPCWPFDKSSESGCSPFAVIKYSMRTNEPTMESRFAQETKILSLLNHPNIMRFYGVTVNNTGKIISRIIEYLPNGTLYSILIGERPKPLTMENHDRSKVENGYQSMSALLKQRMKENNNYMSTTESRQLKRRKTTSSQNKEPELPRPTDHINLNNKQLVKWIIEICDAVIYLHTKHFLHRDIATRNCLIGSQLEIKLSDFNFVQKFTIGHDLIGSKYEYIPIRWLPKETLESLMFNIDTDVWMFGVFMWEVMSLGKQPYDEMDLNEACEAIISGMHLSIPNNCPDDIYEQMKLCWVEPNSRPCLENIKRNLKKILE